MEVTPTELWNVSSYLMDCKGYTLIHLYIWVITTCVLSRIHIQEAAKSEWTHFPFVTLLVNGIICIRVHLRFSSGFDRGMVRLVRDWGYVEPDPKYVATLRFLWGGISTQACGELSVVLWTQNRMPDSTVRWIVRISDTTHVRSNVFFLTARRYVR